MQSFKAARPLHKVQHYFDGNFGALPPALTVYRDELRSCWDQEQSWLMKYLTRSPTPGRKRVKSAGYRLHICTKATQCQ
jgi:hypothetical protein